MNKKLLTILAITIGLGFAIFRTHKYVVEQISVVNSGECISMLNDNGKEVKGYVVANDSEYNQSLILVKLPNDLSWPVIVTYKEQRKHKAKEIPCD